MCQCKKPMLFTNYSNTDNHFTNATQTEAANVHTREDLIIICRICLAALVHITILSLMIKAIEMLYK